MALFRLLHCSDLHLSAHPNRYGLPDSLSAIRTGQWSDIKLVSTFDPVVVDAMVSFAFDNQAGLDAVILSGDLATTGHPEDLTEVVALLEAVPSAGYLTPSRRPTLRAVSKPLLLLPGNHDRFGSVWGLYGPGSMRFDQALSSYWPAQQGAHELHTARRAGAALVVLAADLTLHSDEVGQGPWGYLGQGRAYQGCVDTLRSLTATARRREVNATVVWVIHFDPTTDEPALQLLDPAVLEAAVAAENVPLVLCGHTHRNGSARFGSGDLYVCGTTGQHYAPDGNFLNVIDIEVEAGAPANVRVRSFRFDGYDKFVPA